MSRHFASIQACAVHDNFAFKFKLLIEALDSFQDCLGVQSRDRQFGLLL